MTKSPLIAVLAGLGVVSTAAVAAAAAETVFAPGYYEFVTRFAGESEAETTRECVTAAEARTRSLERILGEMTEGSCTYTQRQIGGGRFALAGSCINEGVRSTFRTSGAYTPTSYNFDLTSRTMMGGVPIDVAITTTGRRIAAACPARAG